MISSLNHQEKLEIHLSYNFIQFYLRHYNLSTNLQKKLTY